MDFIATLLVGLGLLFFVAGSMGLVRLPDAYSRLHALTKADNVGLGLLVAGLLLWPDADIGGKAVLAWLLVLAAGATAAYLIARHIHGGERG